MGVCSLSLMRNRRGAGRQFLMGANPNAKLIDLLQFFFSVDPSILAVEGSHSLPYVMGLWADAYFVPYSY